MATQSKTVTERADVRLPQSSSRLAREYAHIKLLHCVRETDYLITAFEGRVFRPGASIPADQLGEHPVALECAGPVGTGRHRDVLWILWRYDWQAGQWIEIARAQAPDASWTIALRDPARAALNPKPRLFAVEDQSRQVAESILRAIDDRLLDEVQPVRAAALNRVYDWVAGRIAQCA